MTTSPTEGPLCPDKPAAVSLRDAGKYYSFDRADPDGCASGLWALRGITARVAAGETLGLIGRNGAGKTTLLQLIAGVLSPSQGAVEARGTVVGLFSLGIGFQDELSGRENVFLNGALLGADRRFLEEKLDAIAAFSELEGFLDKPLGSYSQGMRLRLAFSIVAHLEFDTLLIDEVLAVGDALFQNKCFERLADFKRRGKTLIITTQGMELIERLCDRVLLLDHGRVLFDGAAREAVERYRQLMAQERFYVGASVVAPQLIEETKKWAQDTSTWGEKLGSKEVVIEKVALLDRWGRECARVKSRASLAVRAVYTVRSPVREAHFGVAFFREDGVYCYGTNTAWDGQELPLLKPGKGSFSLRLPRLLLAPGKYRISVAVWDKDETIAYDYHDGYYRLTVEGAPNPRQALLALTHRQHVFASLFARTPYLPAQPAPEQVPAAGPVRLSVVSAKGKPLDVCMTNEEVGFQLDCPGVSAGGWAYMGIYRDDGILCQEFLRKPRAQRALFHFSSLALLPGRYRIAAGIWDARRKAFVSLQTEALLLKVRFDRFDHGTVYLKHSWTIEGGLDGCA